MTGHRYQAATRLAPHNREIGWRVTPGATRPAQTPGGPPGPGSRLGHETGKRFSMDAAGVGVLVLVAAVTAHRSQGAEQGPLGIGDLAAYRAALAGRSERDEAPVRVTFRDLWDRPAAFQGRRVQVSGTISRRFRQGAYGVFPPLDEVWVVAGARNPVCLVSPSPSTPSCKLGDTVSFTGVYLKRVEYQGGDAARLAPLVVGPDPPSLLKAAVPAPGSASGLSALDWTVGLVVTGLVVLVLGRQHLRRRPRPLAGPEITAPPPEFVRPGFEENGSAVSLRDIEGGDR